MSEAMASQQVLFCRVVGALAREDALNFHRDLGKPSPERYLADVWENAGLRWLGSSEPPRGLSVRRYELSDRIHIDVIQLPAPRKAPDAAYVAVVYWMEKLMYGNPRAEVGKAATGAKTFTLELAEGQSPEEREYCVYESWGMFRQTAYCHGALKPADEGSFVTFVRGVVGAPASYAEFSSRPDRKKEG